MKKHVNRSTSVIFGAIALCGALVATTKAQEDKPGSFTSAELAERTLHRRAIEAVIWGMPAVNAELMFQAMKDAKADFNQVVYWSRPLSWKNQTLTPNPDTIYVFPFFNTKDVGPMVLEIPTAEEGASITGSIDDAWQTALEDVGPAGVDKGKGGKYLILPPGFSARRICQEWSSRRFQRIRSTGSASTPSIKSLIRLSVASCEVNGGTSSPMFSNDRANSPFQPPD